MPSPADLTPDEVAALEDYRRRREAESKSARMEQDAAREDAAALDAELSAALVRWYAYNIIARSDHVSLDWSAGIITSATVRRSRSLGQYHASVDRGRGGEKSDAFAATPGEALRVALRGSMPAAEWDGLRRLCDWVMADPAIAAGGKDPGPTTNQR